MKLDKVREVNAKFSAMVSHYLFEAEFCNPASGWEKGQIEKNVRDSRHRLWQTVPPFGSLDALNDWLADQCVLLWQQIRHPEQDDTIWNVWSDERPHLMQVGQAFDGYVENTKRVSPTCLVIFERNRPERRMFINYLAGQPWQHHKPPEVLKPQVFCFWSAGGILTTLAAPFSQPYAKDQGSSVDCRVICI